MVVKFVNTLVNMFKPLQDYVLVRPIPRSRSDVITVITAEIDQGSIGERAEILAVGVGKKSKRGKIIPLLVQPGEICWYGGERLGCIQFPRVDVAGVSCKVIQEADIMFLEAA